MTGKLPIPLLTWSKENNLKLNLGKCYLIVSGAENAKTKQDVFTIINEKKQERKQDCKQDSSYFI